MKILIIEDEVLTAWSIEEGLREKGYTEIEQASDIQSAYQLLDEFDPDMVLLDINLGQVDKEGIMLAHLINSKKRMPIIFITGESSSGVIKKAIEARPANYLLKPIDFDQLAANIELALLNFSFNQEAQPLSETPSYKLGADTLFQNDDMLFFKKKNRFEKKKLSDIRWVQADNVYTDIFFADGRETLSMTLKRFEEQVHAPHLIKINRSQLINIKYIDAFESHRLFIDKQEFRITEKFKSVFFSSMLSSSRWQPVV